MQDNGLSLQVDSIGLHRDKETIRFVNGIIWNGKKLQKLSPLPFNMWLKGNLNWKFGVPKLLLLSFRMRGEAIIRTEHMDSVSISKIYFCFVNFITEVNSDLIFG